VTGKDIRVEHRDGIAIVTLDRPARRNAMTVPMCIKMHAALQAIAQSDARVVLIHGQGGDFCVGADIDAPKVEREGKSLMEATGLAFESAKTLHAMPQVTIAAIDGGCAGGGFGWAAACDLRFASTRAKFATAFFAIGGSGDMGLIWSLTRIAGQARAREMMLFPEKFGAAQALAWNIVTRVYEPEALFEESLAAAQRLAAAPAFSLRMMKANLLSAETLPFDAYADIETARMMAISEGGALREGFAAFRAARPTKP
jgi:2-(1,2-epoxy-1,2-dihydrophenyl)acetyl-CoA isomerase